MLPSFRSDAEEWLLRAERDLALAERALGELPILGEGAAYHAQQAAEKALKGFLVAYGQPFARTHDLALLLSDCVAIAPTFSRYQAIAPTLSIYATQFRYPGGPLEPSEADARDALHVARDIVAFVRERVAAT